MQLQAATCAKLHNWTAPLASAVRARHAATARAIAEENLHKSVSACYTVTRGVTDTQVTAADLLSETSTDVRLTDCEIDILTILISLCTSWC